MDIAGKKVLVTGANRGLGRQFTLELLERGATVYAAARNPDSIDIPGVQPLRLDITDPDQVQAAAETAKDISLLINNAGSSTSADLLNGELTDIRLEMETHYFGTLAMVRAFAPVLAAQGGGSILNVLSVLSWISFPPVGPYAAAKSAAWSMSNTLRQQLAEQGIRLSALHVGYMDTDMAANIDGPKSDPRQVAKLALDGINSGSYQILADELSHQVQAQLSGGIKSLYPQLP